MSRGPVHTHSTKEKMSRCSVVVAGTTDSAEFQRAKAAAEVRLAKRCLPAPFMADCWAHPGTRTFGGESHGGLTTDAASPSSSLGRRHLSRLWNNLGIREPSGRQMGRIFACACVWVASKRVSTDIGWPCCHRLNNGSSTQHSSPKLVKISYAVSRSGAKVPTAV